MFERDDFLRTQVTGVAQSPKGCLSDGFLLHDDVVFPLEQLVRVVVLRGQVDVQRVARDGTRVCGIGWNRENEKVL